MITDQLRSKFKYFWTLNKADGHEIEESVGFKMDSRGRRIQTQKCTYCQRYISNSNFSRHTRVCELGLSPMHKKTKKKDSNSELNSSIDSDRSLIIDKVICPLCNDQIRKKLKNEIFLYGQNLKFLSVFRRLTGSCKKSLEHWN